MKTIKEFHLYNSDNFVNVKDFGAVGDGETDDTAAIKAAISKAIEQKKILFFNTGNYKITSQINISGNIEIQGQGSLKTSFLFVSEDNNCINATGFIFSIKGIKIVKSNYNRTGNGIKYKWTGDTTGGFRNQFNDLHIVGFEKGFELSNIELGIYQNLYAYGCDYGFWIDAEGNSTGATTISNTFINCRAHESTTNGFRVDKTTHTKFLNCQSLKGSVAVHFFMSGSTADCNIEGLDVESGTNSARIGINISGTRHFITNVNCFNLYQGFKISSAAGVFLHGVKWADCTSAPQIDSGSSKTIVTNGLTGILNNSTTSTIFNNVNANFSTFLNIYVNDATADADSNLPNKAFYKLTGDRSIYQKP
jgi:hypothetical protein